MRRTLTLTCNRKAAIALSLSLAFGIEFPHWLENATQSTWSASQANWGGPQGYMRSPSLRRPWLEKQGVHRCNLHEDDTFDFSRREGSRRTRASPKRAPPTKADRAITAVSIVADAQLTTVFDALRALPRPCREP